MLHRQIKNKEAANEATSVCICDEPVTSRWFHLPYPIILIIDDQQSGEAHRVLLTMLFLQVLA